MSTDAAYPQDVDLCHAIIHHQSTTIAQMQRELEQLKHFVALLQRQRFGPRSEKLDPDQLSLFEEPAEEAAQQEASSEEPA